MVNKSLLLVWGWVSISINLFSLFFIGFIHAIVLNVLHNSNIYQSSFFEIFQLAYDNFELNPYILIYLGGIATVAFCVLLRLRTTNTIQHLVAPLYLIITLASIATALSGVMVRESSPNLLDNGLPEIMEHNAGWPLPFVRDNGGSPLHDIGTISTYDWYNRPSPPAYLINMLFYAGSIYVLYRGTKSLFLSRGQRIK